MSLVSLLPHIEPDHSQARGCRSQPLICHLKLSNNDGNNYPSLRKHLLQGASKFLIEMMRYIIPSFLLTKPKGICTSLEESAAVWKAQREGGWERHKDELHIMAQKMK